jgi:hypothetical protein
MSKIRASACSRLEEFPDSLLLTFNREPTDEEMRMIHDSINMLLDAFLNQELAELNGTDAPMRSIQ